MKQSNHQYVTLYNGVHIPMLCYGPGIIKENQSMVRNIFTHKDYSLRALSDAYVNYKKNQTLSRAYDIGYRCFDTSAAYSDCEKLLGSSLRQKKRNTYFVTTKISNQQQLGKNVKRVYQQSLKNMGLKYVDLYLMHWPQPGYLETWKQMEELYLTKKVRAIGVCNFQLNHFEELLKVAEVKPMVHQFEIHPLFSQEKLCRYCVEQDIQIMAYTPIARGDDRLMNNSGLRSIAIKHRKDIVQVILRWHFQKKQIPVLSSANKQHLQNNINIFDFALNEKEMLFIDSLNINSRLRYDANNCNFHDL